MKMLAKILHRIGAVENALDDIAADRGLDLTREIALGALAYCCLKAEEHELLHAAFAREAPVGEAETAAVACFDALSARFGACTTTEQARDIYEEHHPGYRAYTPVMIRVIKALELAT